MRRILFLFIILIICLNVYSQSEKVKIVILDFKPLKVEKDIAELVTEYFTTAVVDLNKYEVIERSQLNKIFNELKLTSGEDFDDSVALEIGKLAKSKIVIIGSVGKLGKNYNINARGIEVETGKILFGKSVKADEEDDLFEEIQELAALISGKDGTKFTDNNENTKPDKRLEKVITNDAEYNRQRKLAIGLIAGGSSMIGVGLATAIVTSIFVFPTPFARDQWSRFYSMQLRDVTYDTEKFANAMQSYSTVYYVTMLMCILGYGMTIAGMVMDFVTIPIFIRLKKYKNKMSFNINFTFYNNNPAIGFRFAF